MLSKVSLNMVTVSWLILNVRGCLREELYCVPSEVYWTVEINHYNIRMKYNHLTCYIFVWYLIEILKVVHCVI